LIDRGLDFSAADYRHMAHALRLAGKGRGATHPNPCVGCLIVHGGQPVGAGWHHQAGEPHAEVLALREAGARARGATAYVTLEPCAHHGRTPPCIDALIRAGIGEVVAAMIDPFPANAGAGLERLRRAGIQVRSGLMEAQARDLNRGFVSRVERKRPWLRLKLAISLDGRTAGKDGRSQWISSQAARTDVQRLRAQAAAVLTGIGTVLADDPRLDVRSSGLTRQPLRVVVDSRARLDPKAKMLTRPGGVLVATRSVEPPWQRAGVEWLTIDADANGRVDLTALLRRLAEREINEVLVESGPTLAGALTEAGLVDEWLVYLAPSLIGPGRPMLSLPGMEKFDQRLHLELLEVRKIGPDLRLRYARSGAR